MAGASLMLDFINLNKWSKAKEELKSMMQDWFVDWRTSANRWVDGIEIVASPLTIYFPASQSSIPVDSNESIQPTEKMRITIRPDEEYSMNQNLTTVVFSTGIGNKFYVKSDYQSVMLASHLMEYYKSLFPRQEQELPLNLFADIIYHIVAAFQGYLHNGYSNVSIPALVVYKNYKNYLQFDKQHVFPNFVLTPCVPCTSTSSTSSDDSDVKSGWTCFKSDKIAQGGKLSSFQHYKQQLTTQYSAHQIGRLIDLHFGRHNLEKQPTQPDAPKLRQRLENAHRFSACLKNNVAWLSDRSFMEIALVANNLEICKLEIYFYTLDELLTSSFCRGIWGRSTIKPPNFSFETPTQQNDRLLDLTAGLSLTDLDTILRIFLEVNFGRLELEKTIFRDNFPTANDHFNSFDEPQMCGLLTTTSAARKLANHAKNVELLRQETMSSPSSIPVAVVDLMQSYLPPLL